ncbi:Dabb family protein [Bacteroides sp. UBA939]|uniref:Dabb family protein n=1 Tax=Bacteroides sp. UBA939 TaxID=1946092 RepID=UPI0025C1DBCE|nr:Dabb family protein [Bacteroides sp. UBA939]
MVKHIVLFKLKDEIPADKKLAAVNEFKKAIEALPAKISVIRKIEVGLNINPAETWSIALYSEFDSLDDVKTYATHPEHVAAGKLIAEVKESRACVDYDTIDN